ncbi:MAG: hypothetical protein KF716_23340 [Anaerolineae bacterium]|nr:hypothetical protein [Anaerolineae bacterium]
MPTSSQDHTDAKSDQTTRNCPECGARIAGGRVGCEALFNEFRFQALSNPHVGAVHWLAFDTYCMQHIDTYCQSAKSYAAHLTRLCCGLEFGGNLDIYAAIPRWLDGTITLEKPAVLEKRGSMTFVDVWNTSSVEETIQRIHTWANHVWTAYASQHALAHEWIRLALSHKPAR